jgi:hypothetical protein
MQLKCGAQIANKVAPNAAEREPPWLPHVNHFIVGMTNSAPSFMPLGQRLVTVLVLV